MPVGTANRGGAQCPHFRPASPHGLNPEGGSPAPTALGTALGRGQPRIDGVDLLLSEAERYDMGWFLACLCTPLIGDDLAGRLPRYRPTSRLARETNGDLAALLPRWRPRRAAQMRVAARYGHEPVGDAAILRGYVDDLGPWLAGEYARVHGTKSASR